jgi:S1-C subfamily serine protease
VASAWYGRRVGLDPGPDGQPAGAGIAAVTPGRLAASAGLQPGDVITAFNGTATSGTEALAAVLAGLQAGQQVPLKITKADGSTATLNLGIGTAGGLLTVTASR